MAPAARPSAGLPVYAATAKPTQAPHSIWPSMPRLTMPTRWVSVSPSVTIISGVDDRSIAAAHEPATSNVSSAMAGAPSSRQAAGAKRCDEQQALQDRGTGARNPGIELKRVAGGNQSADQDCNRYRAQKMLAGEPRHQKTGQAVADREAGLQPSLDRRCFADAGDAGKCAADRHDEQALPDKAETRHRANLAIARKHLQRDPPARSADTDMQDDRGDHA